MTRLTAAAAFVLALLAFDAGAQLTLQPLPGTTPQETCFSCVFPNEVGVIVRDGFGEPVANVAVTFTTLASTLGMVRYDDFCCVAHDDVTVSTGPDGIARATAITISQPSSAGRVMATVAGIPGTAYFDLASTAQRATQLVAVDSYHYQYTQMGTHFQAPWTFRVLDANGQPVPRTMVQFYTGDWGGPQARASFNGGSDWALAVADANGTVVSPIARAEDQGDEGGWGAVHASPKANLDNEFAPFDAQFFFVTDYAITSRSAAVVGNPPDSVQLESIAAAPYAVRVLDASGAPAVGMPVHFVTVHSATDPRCMSLFRDGAGDEINYTDANGIATASVLYGNIPGPCTLKIWPAGLVEPIVRQVHVFDPANVVVRPRHEWVASRTGHDYRVTLDFTENGRRVQPGAIDWVEAKRYLPGLPAGITGEPEYTFANNSATIELRANQWPGLYDLEVMYWSRSNNKARVHVLQLP